MRRLLAILVLFAAVPASSSRVAAAAPGQVSVRAHGVKLTLTVPRRVYPQNALIAVHVSLRNVSRRTIWEAPMVVGYCSRVDFLVDVLDTKGQPLSPLPPAPGPYPPCTAPLPYPLHPAQTLSRTVFVVLLAGRLRATANVNTLSGTRNYAGMDVVTPVVTVTLHPASAPAVTVQTPSNTVAVVAKPPDAKGPLRYEQWSICGVGGARVLTWSTAASSSVDAGCLQPREWHLVAGWVNYPVTFVNMKSPTASIVLTPPFLATPYTIHVGEVLEVKVLLLGPGEDVADADSAYLRLLSTSAIGAEPVRYDWRWQALKTGNTQITINRQYPSGLQYVIRLHIVP